MKFKITIKITEGEILLGENSYNINKIESYLDKFRISRKGIYLTFISNKAILSNQIVEVNCNENYTASGKIIKVQNIKEKHKFKNSKKFNFILGKLFKKLLNRQRFGKND